MGVLASSFFKKGMGEYQVQEDTLPQRDTVCTVHRHGTHVCTYQHTHRAMSNYMNKRVNFFT